jgi:hypothetical protein
MMLQTEKQNYVNAQSEKINAEAKMLTSACNAVAIREAMCSSGDDTMCRELTAALDNLAQAYRTPYEVTCANSNPKL